MNLQAFAPVERIFCANLSQVSHKALAQIRFPRLSQTALSFWNRC
jgi:hypothetical protein